MPDEFEIEPTPTGKRLREQLEEVLAAQPDDRHRSQVLRQALQHEREVIQSRREELPDDFDPQEAQKLTWSLLEIDVELNQLPPVEDDD